MNKPELSDETRKRPHRVYDTESKRTPIIKSHIAFLSGATFSKEVQAISRSFRRNALSDLDLSKQNSAEENTDQEQVDSETETVTE